MSFLFDGGRLELRDMYFYLILPSNLATFLRICPSFLHVRLGAGIPSSTKHDKTMSSYFLKSHVSGVTLTSGFLWTVNQTLSELCPSELPAIHRYEPSSDGRTGLIRTLLPFIMNRGDFESESQSWTNYFIAK